MDNIGIIEAKYKSCASLAIQRFKEVGIAEREDSFKHHIQNAPKLGLMPDDFKVIKVTLDDYGFIMQSSRLENAYFSDVVAALGISINTPSTVLITIRNYMHMGRYMVSLKTDGAHSFRFTCPDPRLQNIGRETVTHVWIRWDDLIDRSPFPRKSVNRHTASPKKRVVKNTDSFHFFNPNPCSNFIGDCVVRAASGAMDISWSEAMDRLASVGETTVNAREVYPKVLEREGFTCHKLLTRNGRRLTGRDFCIEMDRQCQKGERIFAHSGRGHAVAIVPVDGHYRVIDSCDSTSHIIGDFWVKDNKISEPEVMPKRIPCSLFAVGESLRHPSFDVGIVIAAVPGVVTIDFDVNGIRRLRTDWVSKNCIRMAA